MAKPLDPEHPGRFSTSLCSGLAMLACFSAERPLRGIADLADELELGRSTTHRYATTLTTLGYLEQDSSRKYRLASRVSDVGLALLNSLPVRQVAHEHLLDLRRVTGHTVGVVILDDLEIIYVDRLVGTRRGQYAVDLGVGLGSRLPAHRTAAGKLLLAGLSESARREALAGLKLTRGGPKGATSKSALRDELDSLSTDQPAVEDEELVAGRRSVAASIATGEGQLPAAVEVVLPVDGSTTAELVKQIGPAVLKAAARISAELG